MRAIAVLCTLVLVVFAGCEQKAALTKDVAPLATTEPGFGGLEGRVVDGELRPIEGVQVNAVGPTDERDATTDALGTYRFEDLIAVPYKLSFYHPRFETRNEVITVQADETLALETSLSLSPENRPYEVLLNPIRGHYDCAAEAVILTGDCLIVWENATHSPNPFTAYDNAFIFGASKGWTTLIIQLVYSSGPNNQLDGMRFYVAPANESRDASAHHTKFAVAEGSMNPLEIRLDVGTPHAKADEWKPGGAQAQLSPTGGDLIGLAYPRGRLADSAGSVCQPDDPDRCFLGVGVAASIDFTAYVGLFYNGQEVPKGFTMVPAA